MAGTAYLASEVVVGDLANKISIASDGSMTFSDAYVPTIKLKDIVSGEIVLDPALMVYIADTDADWTAQSANSYGQVFYKVTINHNWDLTNDNDTNNIFPIGAAVKIYDTNNKEISVESIQHFPNYVEIISSKKLTIKVSIKKIG